MKLKSFLKISLTNIPKAGLESIWQASARHASTTTAKIKQKKPSKRKALTTCTRGGT